MRIKDGYLLREIADCAVVVPIGERVIDFKGMMILSESAALLWRNLADNCSHEQLLQLLVDEYDVTRDRAEVDLDEFLSVARQNGVLDEC